jgi:hypothetical protein
LSRIKYKKTREGVVRKEDFAWQKLKPLHYVVYDVIGEKVVGGREFK